MRTQSRSTSQTLWVPLALFGFIVLTATFGAKYSTLARPLGQRGASAPGGAAQQHVRAQGHQVAALIAAGNARALFLRFTPDMARAVSEGQLTGLLAQVRALGPLRAPTGESVRAVGGGGHVYVGDYGPTGHGLRLSVVFLPGDAIQGLLLRPR